MWKEGIHEKRSAVLTIVQDDQERRQQVTHTLDIAHLQVLPDVAVRERREPHLKHQDRQTVTLTNT